MIKHINHQNILTTPFVAAKSWNVSNINNDSFVLMESSGSDGFGDIALEYIDYTTGTPLLNSDCNIVLEQQPSNVLFYEEGITGSGRFDPDTDPKNNDGTYKRLVHNQIKTTFYNSYRNPFAILGTEYIDFSLSNTIRNISDNFRMFNIPRNVFGEKIVPQTVQFEDNNLDDSVTIFDDGYQNLIAGFNLFSKVQEIKTYQTPTSSNRIFNGDANNTCATFLITSNTPPIRLVSASS